MKEEEGKSETPIAQSISSHYSQPWIFQHQELLTFTTTELPLDQKKLVNKINHLNFIDSYVFILCRYQQTGEHILMKAYPQPCVKDELICRLDPKDNLPDMTEYNLDYLMIDDGLTAILAPVQLVSVENHTLKLNLPDESRVIKTRKTRRYNCQDISCEIIHDRFNTHGQLIDFTPNALGIKLTGNENMKGFVKNDSALINLTQNGTKIFSGSCRCIRNGMNSPDGKVVLKPLSAQMALFPKRKTRNPRQHITPSFAIIYKHPFFQKNIERDILEISTSGFSVLDNIEEETLLPGMIITNISVVYASIIKMDCSAQVVYRQEDQENNIVQCGLAITDMDVQSYSYLNHILGSHLDNHARVSTEVDMESLWEFFFDTGFIYGEKYEHLYPYRKTFNETYKKLYQDNPDIARHFVYEQNGKIYGHMSMVHAYKPSWLIQHFAARPMEDKIAGRMILRQITHYLNGIYRFASGGMDYIMAYYRPENEIMNQIFGGIVEYLGNRQGSSLDLFSYIMSENALLENELPSNWTLHECTPNDLKIMKDFYENYSGGLMLNALGLDIPMTFLRESFAKVGFIRNCQTFCLYLKDKIAAFFIVNKSDIGLNLCDLLNGIKIIIVNDEGLKWDIILAAINKLGVYYKESQIPLLVFPSNYLAGQGVSADKNYQLWILKTDPFMEQYTDYMGSKFRIRYRTTDGKNTSI
jgi:hypothetical protein